MLLRGLLTTLKAFFLEKPVTIQYPEEKRLVRTRFRGRHVLRRYENGLERCIGCSLCAAACPADAIFVEASENTDEARYSPGERYASTYQINMLRCIFCGYCEDACPTEAIVSGDLHDPDSPASRLRRAAPAVARRPEQNTGPNVWYLGMDEVSLRPGRAAEPPTWLWSDRRMPPPPAPHGALHAVPNARTVLGVDHPRHWGWRVEAYLVTKGIAAGAGMLAPFAAHLGLGGAALAWLPETLALVGTLVTCVLLIADLKRPHLFFRLLTRPNTRSWLVKGGWVLTAFLAAAAGALGARLLGLDGAAAALRWSLLPLGAATAGYTAFLFAQCEGRDLWQHWRLLLPHLLVQAVALGGAFLLLAAPSAALAQVVAFAAVLHLVCVALEKAARHETDNARHAAALLWVVPAWPGAAVPAATVSTVFVLAAATGLLLGAWAGVLSVGLALAAAAALTAGTFAWERAYVRAGQMPPLS